MGKTFFDNIKTFCKIGRNGMSLIVVGKNNSVYTWSNEILNTINNKLKKINEPIKIPIYGLSRAEIGHFLNSIKSSTINKNVSVLFDKTYIILISPSNKIC